MTDGRPEVDRFTPILAEVRALGEGLERVESSLRRLHRAVVGDPEVGTIGLARRMERLEDTAMSVPEMHQRMTDDAIAREVKLLERIERVERRVDRGYWVLLGAALAGGALARLIEGAFVG